LSAGFIFLPPYEVALDLIPTLVQEVSSFVKRMMSMLRAFGGNQFFYWSFINEENPQWRRSSSSYNYHGKSWNWRHRNEETYDSSSESEFSESDMVSDRLALGLNASGPLKLEDVKHA